MAKKNVKVNATEEIVDTGIVKEEEVMANEVITNAEVTAVKEEEVLVNETTTREMILFTASRGKNTKLAWSKVTVDDNDPTVKVKGVAAELPVQAAEIIGTDKFVAWVDKEVVEKCVEEQKAVRGTASTVSDVYNRYCKVTDTKGDRVKVALAVFGEVLAAIEAGTTNGAWVRPEPEKQEAPEAPTEGEDEAPVDEINPDDVVDDIADAE